MKHEIKNIKNEALIADMALGFEPEIEVPQKWDLLNRYLKSGFSYVGLAISGEFTSLDTAIQYISRHRALIQNDPQYLLVKSTKDILLAKQQEKLGLGFWLQGANPLANDLHMVETYYSLGVRYILLCL